LSAGLEVNSGRTKEKPFFIQEGAKNLKCGKEIQVRGAEPRSIYVSCLNV